MKIILYVYPRTLLIIQKQGVSIIANDSARKSIDELFEDYDDNY